jgi:hypothetical protein
MTSQNSRPIPQPTESEAIVAAQRESTGPETPLVSAVPLPVDLAAALPPDGTKTAGPAPSQPSHFGGSVDQVERRLPESAGKAQLEVRRKDDGVGGED